MIPVLYQIMQIVNCHDEVYSPTYSQKESLPLQVSEQGFLV